jgi:hypothetical protein
METRFDPSRFYIDTSNQDAGMQVFLLDQTGFGANRLMGRMGCVGAGFVALQSLSSVVVLDVMSGEVRWTRTDLRADDELFADDEYIFASTGHGAGTRVFRASDGAEVNVPSFVKPLQSRIDRLGRLLLLSETDNQNRTVVRLYDILTGKDSWKHVSPPTSVVARSVEPGYTAVVEPDGTARVFDLRAGKEVVKTEVDPHDFTNMAVVRLAADRTHFYLLPWAALKPGDRLDSPPTSGVPNLRTVPVNGTMWALTRTPDHQDWSNGAKYQEMILDQIDDMPILLFASQFYRNRGNQGEVDQILAVQAIDKSSGKYTFGDNEKPSKGKEYINIGAAFHALVVDQQALTIELIGANVKIRHSK